MSTVWSQPCGPSDEWIVGDTHYRLGYRTATGHFETFHWSSTSAGTQACGVSGTDMTLGNHRGSSVSLTIHRGTQTFEVRDLRTGERSLFDSNGRITRRFVPTSAGGAGWQVARDTQGNLSTVSYWAGDANAPSHQLVFQYDAPHRTITNVAWRLGTTGALHQVAAFSSSPNVSLDSITLPPTNPSLSSANRVWTFAYDGVGGAGGGQYWSGPQLSRATDPAGVLRVQLTHPPAPGGCFTSGIPTFRTSTLVDVEGGYEFRRKGTPQGNTPTCSGSTMVADPNEPNNPCSAGGANSVAVLVHQRRQLDASHSVVTCASDAYCGAGFLCSTALLPLYDSAGNRAGADRQCVRYYCQQSTGTNLDEPVQLTDPSGGTSCGSCQTHALTWASIGTTEPVRRVRSRQYADGHYRTYTHDDQGRLTRVCDGDTDTDATACPSTAAQTDYTYDAALPFAIATVTQSSPLSTTQAHVTTYSRNGLGQVYQVQEVGNTYSDTSGTVSAQTRTTNWYFHASSGLWVSQFGPGARHLERYFNPAGSTAESMALYVSYEYTSGSAALATWEYAHDERGNPTQVQAPGLPSETRTYDAAGQLASTSLGGRLTAYAYDAYGRFLSVRRPSGQAVVYSYSGLSTNPSRLTTTDAPTLDSTNTFALAAPAGDYVNNPVDPMAVARVTAYGRHTSAGDVGALVTRELLDDRGRVATRSNGTAGAATTTYEFDPLSNRVSATVDGAGRRTQFAYENGQGRLQTVQRDPAGVNAQTQLGYPSNSDRPSSVTYPNGSVLSYTYDDFGALILTTGADLGTRRVVYDLTGRPSQRFEPDGTRTVFTYDAAGRTTAIDYDADHPTNYAADVTQSWDALPSGVSCPDASGCSNLLGRLAYVTVGHTSSPYKLWYGYASTGETTYEASYLEGKSYPTWYTYDSAGRLTDTSFPLGTGDAAHLVYDSTAPADAERAQYVDSYLGSYLYHRLLPRVDRDATGAVTGLWYNWGNFSWPVGSTPTWPASVARSYRGDQSGQLDTVQWRTTTGTSADLASYQYGYGSDGRLSSIASLGGTAALPAYYHYDTLGRLDCAGTGPLSAPCAAGGSTLAMYSYNGAGDRTSSWDPATSTHAVTQYWNSSRDYSVTSGGTTVYTAWGYPPYAAPGQRLYDYTPGQGYRYYQYWPTGEPRLVSILDGSAAQTAALTMRNDHRGRRIYARYAAGSAWTEWHFFYDLQSRLHAVHEQRSTGEERRELYFWIEQELAFRYVLDQYNSELERTFFFNDHLGTPRVAVNVNTSFGAPQVIYQASRDPFLAGAPQTMASGVQPVRQRFPGQWADENTGLNWLASGSPYGAGLVNNQARELDPGRGSYTSVEPLILSGHSPPMPFNSYVSSNPISAIDPNGQFELVPALLGLGALCARDPARCQRALDSAVSLCTTAAAAVGAAAAGAMAVDAVSSYMMSPFRGRASAPASQTRVLPHPPECQRNAWGIQCSLNNPSFSACYRCCEAYVELACQSWCLGNCALFSDAP